ncbi:membrane protein [Caballeronia catudaia]|uniref:Membrane protein n=1 Tax=Caballeronia catudaia TaxID=1777136 RepID=A0A158D1T3_9BURK|nr:DUF883 family protein [Caballeronia catudaia]SAK88300.1 membrane protein [Caballeronia catudaia]
MANTVHEPVDSLITEKADTPYEFPTSANHGASGGDTQPPATAGDGNQREASQSGNNQSSGDDARASMKNKLSDMQDTVAKNYRLATETTDDFVHDNPWKAIAIAALGGVIIGMLVSR